MKPYCRHDWYLVDQLSAEPSLAKLKCNKCGKTKIIGKDMRKNTF